MDSLLDLLDQNHKMMGTVTLTRAGRVIYNKAIGYSNLTLSNASFNDTVTRYRIGSITKVFTATMIFQLIEENYPWALLFPNFSRRYPMRPGSLLT